jgi:hypothetical protein
MELVGGRGLSLSKLCQGELVLWNVAYKHTCLTKKEYLGVWHADWVFRAPESTVNNVK